MKDLLALFTINIVSISPTLLAIFGNIFFRLMKQYSITGYMIILL